jgi:hypothetical protein
MSGETLNRIDFKEGIEIPSRGASYIDSKGVVKVSKNIERLHANDGNDYYSRFYYTFSQMEKEKRMKIKIDNETIVEIDAVALHPRLLGAIYHQKTGNNIPEILIGDVHTNISKMLGIKRIDAKGINLSYWNSRIYNNGTLSSYENKILFQRMDEFIKTEYPKLWKWLVYVKCEMMPLNGSEPHKNMSIILMDREVRFMNDVIKSINTPCLYCYDAIYVKESECERVEIIFEEILNNHLNK